MCDLEGAALDAAVAQALRLPNIVYRPSGQPAYEFEFDPEGPASEFSTTEWKMWRYYRPSDDGAAAMLLQAEHDVACYPDSLAKHSGAERWVAGFEIEAKVTEDGHTSDAGTHWPAESMIEMRCAARGRTPMEAVSRALVVRNDVEKALAWNRAQNARRLRRPYTDFETDRARVLYAEAMEQQLALVQAQNPTLYPEV